MTTGFLATEVVDLLAEGSRPALGSALSPLLARRLFPNLAEPIRLFDGTVPIDAWWEPGGKEQRREAP
jgi:hypothetical protein